MGNACIHCVSMHCMHGAMLHVYSCIIAHLFYCLDLVGLDVLSLSDTRYMYMYMQCV